MKIDPEKNCPFSTDAAPFGDVVLSSRARLARNLEGFPFVNRSASSDCMEVTSLVRRICENDNSRLSLEWVDMDELDDTTTQMFVERHLISSHLAESTHPRAIAVGPELSRSVMVNEEDHVRIQSIRPGLQLHETRNDVHTLDLSIEEVIAYAFDEQLGFITACPTNLGTGARFSVMLHLPGLRIIKDLPRVHQATQAMSLAIRGYRGEGSGTVADLFQVSNQLTLGETEENLCNILSDEFLPPVIEWERRARMQIAKEQSSKLDDQIFRAIGVLRNARILTPEEAMNYLGNIRLGICLDRITEVEISTINKLMIEIHPGHLRWKYGTELADEEIDCCRADLIRDKFGT